MTFLWAILIIKQWLKNIILRVQQKILTPQTTVINIHWAIMFLAGYKHFGIFELLSIYPLTNNLIFLAFLSTAIVTVLPLFCTPSINYPYSILINFYS